MSIEPKAPLSAMEKCAECAVGHCEVLPDGGIKCDAEWFASYTAQVAMFCKLLIARQWRNSRIHSGGESDAAWSATGAIELAFRLFRLPPNAIRPDIGTDVLIDKKGRPIRAGDTIRLTFLNRQREHPGRRRVAIEGVSGQEVVVPDEGGMKPASLQWVEFFVYWSGACLVAKRIAQSDFQTLMSGENTSIVTGRFVPSTSAARYLDATFDGSEFELMSTQALAPNQQPRET